MCDGCTQCMSADGRACCSCIHGPTPTDQVAHSCAAAQSEHTPRRYICKILPANWHATSLGDRWRGHGAGGAPPSWTWGANPQFRLSCAVGASVVIVCSQPDTKNLKQARLTAWPISDFASHLCQF